jgi:hypothetical protein
MKYSKKSLIRKYHTSPILNFEQQQLTSFSGLLIFQKLFFALDLKRKLNNCFSHLKHHPIYGIHNTVLILIVHVLLGFRKIRDIKNYGYDPMVRRTLGMTRLPDPSSISRILCHADEKSIKNIRKLSRNIVLEGLQEHNINRVTTDFDGSVIFTKRHAENSAVGYNKKKKGSRSYYPLFGTIAQTGQVLDTLHRSGNVHDSNGAVKFVKECFESLQIKIPSIKIESRMDGAFFSQDMVEMLSHEGTEFTKSVPFMRLTELKAIVEGRQRWRTIDEDTSFFEMNWKPKSWNNKYRFIFVRRIQQKQHKAPLQLDLFLPNEYEYQYSVIITSKNTGANNVIDFHAGRGSQENVFGELKTQGNMDYIPFKRYIPNQIFLLSSVLAHNINRTMQMNIKKKTRHTSFKRTALWVFNQIGTIRRDVINRAGRFTKPQGYLTLTISGNDKVENEFKTYIDGLSKAA